LFDSKQSVSPTGIHNIDTSQLDILVFRNMNKICQLCRSP